MTAPDSDVATYEARHTRRGRKSLRQKQCACEGCESEAVVRSAGQRYFCSAECRIAVADNRAEVKQPCRRETCRRLANNASDGYCTLICRAIDDELARAQRICEALGAGNPMASKVWAETVALSDGWSQLRELDSRLYRAALSVGFTDEQWQTMKEG